MLNLDVNRLRGYRLDPVYATVMHDLVEMGALPAEVASRYAGVTFAPPAPKAEPPKAETPAPNAATVNDGPASKKGKKADE
jgi:hypothetical protein